jgi:hypothetical protein
MSEWSPTSWKTKPAEPEFLPRGGDWDAQPGLIAAIVPGAPTG